VQIVGIDCAAQPKNVGIAYARGRQVLGVSAAARDPLAQILEWVDWTQPVLVAMDAPLGWPSAMSAELGDHRPGDPIRTSPNEFFRRTTDRRIHAVLGKLPLDIGADRIARAAHGALGLLDALRRESGCSLPLLWEPDPTAAGVIEVYPAGTLKAHGLPFGGYKSADPKQGEVRREIADRLSETLTLPNDPIIRANADALDSVVCVLSGLDFLEGACIQPGQDRSTAAKEGWIWARAPGSAR
jgi:predicted nuclease with RNAse H fold